jgi:predicted cobalt transporter CbtA
MSPVAQYAAVATITFAALGFQIVALTLLGVTAVLLLGGFITLAPRGAARPETEEVPIPEPRDTPEEAFKQDG